MENMWKMLKNLLPAGIVLVLIGGLLAANPQVLPEIPERLAAFVAEERAEAAELPAEAEEESETEPAGVGNYEDGVYTGSSQGYGGPVKVQVTVENGQIVSIDLLSHSGETSAYFRKAQAVVDEVLHAQTWEVDTISGATYSSRGILGAVKNAITGETVTNPKAEKVSAPKSTESVSFTKPAGGYKDGTYTGSAQGFGGQIKVTVTIKDGKITAVTVNSHSGETSSYYNKAKAVTGRIVKAQSPNVDTVSGATYSSRGIINAAKKALNKAAVNASDKVEVEEETTEEETEPETEPVIPSADDIITNPVQILNDGVYKGTAEGFGGDVTVQVTVSDGKITNIEILEAEDETPMYLRKALAVIPSIITAQSTDVDTVSGATYSSGGIRDAVAEALKAAIKSAEDEKESSESESSDSGESSRSESSGSDESSAGESSDSGESSAGESSDSGESSAGESSDSGESSGSESGDSGESSGSESSSSEESSGSETGESTEDTAKQTYANGTYTVKATVVDVYEDFWDYEIILNVTYDNEKITAITFASGNTFDNNTDNEFYSKRALNGYSKYKGMASKLTGTDGTQSVDTVSGATCSSKAILSAVKKAAEMAKKAAE